MKMEAVTELADFEQSLPKTTIAKPIFLNKQTANSLSKPTVVETIVIDDDSDSEDDFVDIEEKSDTVQIRHEDNDIEINKIVNGGFQLAVLREVDLNDAGNMIGETIVVENTEIVRKKRGRPKGYIMKKKEDTDTNATQSNAESDDGSEKKSFSLKLDFLGKFQKHKSKVKRKKSIRDSIDEKSAPIPKRGRPLVIKKADLSIEVTNNDFDKLDNENNSDTNIKIIMKEQSVDKEQKEEQIENKPQVESIKENGEVKADVDTNLTSKEMSGKVINVRPISLQSKRLGRPKGPPKPIKIKGKRGRKPNPNKVVKLPIISEISKTVDNSANSENDTSEVKTEIKLEERRKRGRPRIYPEKPIRPKGPRGRPRLIKLHVADRNSSVKFIKDEIEFKPNERNESFMNSTMITTEPKKKRGRPLGYSPLGKTLKQLGRPKKNFRRGFHSGRGTSKLIGKTSLNIFKPSSGRPRGRPRKYPVGREKLPGENSDIKINENYISEDDNNKDNNSDVSISDKNFETIIDDGSQIIQRREGYLNKPSDSQYDVTDYSSDSGETELSTTIAADSKEKDINKNVENTGINTEYDVTDYSSDSADDSNSKSNSDSSDK